MIKHFSHLFCIAATLFLVLALCVGAVGGAATQVSVKYIDATGAEQTCSSATVVDDSATTWNAGWYVVQNDVTIRNQIILYGDVHLILANSSNLTVTGQADGAIYGNDSGASLTIYAQSSGDNMGALNANGGLRGIFINNGSLTINGGTVTATATGNGQGINADNIFINDGTVTATANGAFSDGIYCEGRVTIYDGTVTAEGGRNGIYCEGRVTIYDGTVTAEGETHGMVSDAITISGGTVNAKGGISGIYSSNGFFSTGENGNAFIIASSIKNITWREPAYPDDSEEPAKPVEPEDMFVVSDDVAYKTAPGTSGVIFVGNSGQVYGSPTLSEDATIPADSELTVPSGSTLTIPAGVTLTNNGNIQNNGEIVNNGVMVNNGNIVGNSISGGGEMHSSITYTAGEGGTVSVAATAAWDTSVTATIQANTGYYIIETKLLDSGSNQIIHTHTMNEGNTSGTITFNMPQNAVELTVNFAKIEYSVHTDTVQNGAITIQQQNPVYVNDQISFTVQPLTGYKIQTVTVTQTVQNLQETNNADGSRTYTFLMPAGDVSISADFTPKTYNIEYDTPAEGGAITTTTASAEYNSPVTITVTEEEGWHLTTLKYTDEDHNEHTISGDHTFTMPASKIRINATFAKTQYIITVKHGTEGHIHVNKESANTGETIFITQDIHKGYELDTLEVKEDKAETPITVTSNQFTMPDDNVTITATFKKIDYDVKLGTSKNGTVTVSTNTAQLGDTVTVTATPDEGYEFNYYNVTTDSGEHLKVNDDETFTMTYDNVTVTAEFSRKLHTVTYTINGKGIDQQHIYHGDDATNPKLPYIAGYICTSEWDNDGKNIVADRTINAEYTLVPQTQPTGGSVSIPENAKAGETVTATATPDSGYVVDKIIVKDKDGNEITITQNGNTATFIMPAGGVTITATFIKETPNENSGSSSSSVWLSEPSTPTQTPTATQTEPELAPTEIPTTEPTATETETPGFGVIAVLGALGAVTVLRRK